MSGDLDRTPAILADMARFAVTARRVVGRGHDRLTDPDDDDQRRIARSLVVDLSVAADRLPETFRQAHPEVGWRGVRAVRTFIAHDSGSARSTRAANALSTEDHSTSLRPHTVRPRDPARWRRRSLPCSVVRRPRHET